MRKRSKDSVSRSINKGCKCEKGEWKLRAKAQAKWFKRTTVSQKESKLKANEETFVLKSIRQSTTSTTITTKVVKKAS